MTRGAVVELVSRWGEVQIGAIGRVVRSWRDPHGRLWARVE